MHFRNLLIINLAAVAILSFVHLFIYKSSNNLDINIGRNCPHIIKFRLDQAFNNKEKNMIAAAGKSWHIASDKSICFKFRSADVKFNESTNYSTDNISTIYSGKTVWQQFITRWDHGCLAMFGCLAVTVREGGMLPDIFVVAKKNFKKMMEHEIGHALGLGHSPNKKDIMYKHVNKSVSITRNDIRVLNCIINKNKLLSWEVCSY